MRRLVLSVLASALFLALAPFAHAQQAPTYELLVRVERWEGTRTGGGWATVTSTEPVTRVTMGSPSGYGDAYINLYARMTNPPLGVNSERVFRGALGFRLSGEDFTGAEIAAMVGAICDTSPGGASCRTAANNMPGSWLPGITGFWPGSTAGASTTNSFYGMFFDGAVQNPGVRCDTVAGGPANVCEAFLTGVPLAGLAELAAAESGVGLLTVTPSGGESAAGDDQTGYSSIVPPALTLGSQVIELCAATGCLIDVDEAPGVPVSLTVAVAVPANSLSVGWQAPTVNSGPALLSYEVEYKVSDAAVTEWSDPITVAAAETSVTIAGLDDETGYDVRVRAVNAEGASAWVETATAVVTGVAVNLRLLPRAPGAGFNSRDALLLYYFTAFGSLLERTPVLSRDVVRRLQPPGVSLTEAELDGITAAALAVPGSIGSDHPANVYDDGTPFDENDAAFAVYALEFGALIADNPLLLAIIVDSVFPGNTFDGDAARMVLLQRARGLASTL